MSETSDSVTGADTQTESNMDGVRVSALIEVAAELRRAQATFGPMASPHEAYAVILEELEEFWLAVKVKNTPPAAARSELVQTAAMALRAIIDCYSDARE